jgi:hypothetical protein
MAGDKGDGGAFIVVDWRSLLSPTFGRSKLLIPPVALPSTFVCNLGGEFSTSFNITKVSTK